MISNKCIDEINDFMHKEDQLLIINRKSENDSDVFFEKLVQFQFSTMGKVRKKFAKQGVQNILKNKIPEILRNDQFYEKWIADMIKVIEVFCSFLKEDSVCFWLGSERGCKRYHVDLVPFRMLVTYAGKGTELLPDETANRNAFINGEPNKKIVKSKSLIKFINKWDIAIFRGGKNGILHRTPNSASNGQSILMRLDHPSFWEKVKDYQKKIEENLDR